MMNIMKGISQNLYALQALDIQGQISNSAQLAALRAGIPEGILANYDRARARGKQAIALLSNHVCTNCRMHVPVAVTASLRAGMIQACCNCGIYLCLVESEDRSEAPTAAAPGHPKRHKHTRAAAPAP
jgi:predicted  nucleic acid-binding Zn-ribbon protein